MTYTTQGIILRKSHQGDFDRQYVIYTRDYGKITAIAKSVKKPTSKLNSHLEFFNLCDLMLARGNSCDRLAAACRNKNYCRGNINPIKIFSACLYLEALDILVKYNYPDEFIFHLSDRFLTEIFSLRESRHSLMVLNRFLFELLSHLGYRPKVLAKTQKSLLADLNNLVMEVAEKPLRSFTLLARLV